MTKLEPGRAVIRETAAFDRTDPLIVELHPAHLVVRLKGKPATKVEVSYAQLLRHGARIPGGRS